MKVSIMGMLLPGRLLLSSGRRDSDVRDGLEFNEENIFRALLFFFCLRINCECDCLVRLSLFMHYSLSNGF